MIDHYSMQLAMRSHALTLLVATTGSTSLSATSTGYARAAGSFVTDGFAVGMEVLVAGFGTAANNGIGVVTAVSALALGVTKSPATVAEAAGAGRTISVGLPASRAWENVSLSPASGRPYVEEQYIPGPSAQKTLGPLGEIEVEPMYSLLVYTPSNTGMTAASKYADKLITLFAPRTAITLGNGDVLRVRTDVGPFRGQLQQGTPGWAVAPITIPFRLRTPNSI